MVDGLLGLAMDLINSSIEKKEAEATVLKILETSKLITNSFNNFVEKISKGNLVFDSNIFLDKDCEVVFEAIAPKLKEEGAKIKVFKIQFDEITNIKDRKDEKSSKARHGLRLIERLSNDDVLEIEPLSVSAEKNAYFDEFIINTLSQSEDNYNIITGDIELRIKLTQIVKKSKPTSNIISGADLTESSLQFMMAKDFIEKFDNNQFSSIKSKKSISEYLPLLENSEQESQNIS
jgi:rRNA-processing protein FCF1